VWTAWRGPELPLSGHRGGSLVASDGSLALLFGADDSESPVAVDELTLNLDAWEWHASPEKRQRRSEQVVLKARGQVFVHGGCPDDPWLRRRAPSGEWVAMRLELGCVRGEHEASIWRFVAESFARKGHAGVVFGDATALLCGGAVYQPERVYSNRLLILDLDTEEIVVQSTLPGPGRSNHSAVAIGSDTCLVFGGRDRSSIFGDLISVDFRGNATLVAGCSGESPCPRAGHGAAALGNFMFVCGGWAGTRSASGREVGALELDLFRFDVQQRVWARIAMPADVIPRDVFAMTLWCNWLVIVGGADREFRYLNDCVFIQVQLPSLQELCVAALVAAGEQRLLSSSFDGMMPLAKARKL
jgi:hypothetical protein